jgi:hypothetical protein
VDVQNESAVDVDGLSDDGGPDYGKSDDAEYLNSKAEFDWVCGMVKPNGAAAWKQFRTWLHEYGVGVASDKTVPKSDSQAAAGNRKRKVKLSVHTLVHIPVHCSVDTLVAIAVLKQVLGAVASISVSASQPSPEGPADPLKARVRGRLTAKTTTPTNGTKKKKSESSKPKRASSRKPKLSAKIREGMEAECT